MEERTIVVTGIGGNVGQGIVRNLRHTGIPFKIIGTNVTAFSPGNHLVDIFEKVPFAFEEGYLPAMMELVKKHNVHLIIPSTDFEVFYLSNASKNFPCVIGAAGPNAAGYYLDKYHTWQHHKKNNIPFADSMLPSQWHGQFEKAIAKPRKGRGSRGLLKLKFDATQLSDEEYMIQELHEGNEITTAVYCSYITGKIKGLITMERSLENGATTYSRVIKDYDDEMLIMAQKMVNHSDLKGSFNIQSIVTNEGSIVPFEINCRISGTNSIRTHFGFADVAYTAQELLFNTEAPEPKVQFGIAHRILMDVIYPGAKSEADLAGTNTDPFILF